MKPSWAWLLLSILLLPAAGQARDLSRLCSAGEGKSTRPLWNLYQLRVYPSRDKQRMCTAEIVAADGGVVFSRDENSFTWNAATGQDVNGDRAPDVVLEGYTGGAHCCWKYWIFSFSPDPMLAGELDNDQPVAFGLASKGRIVLHTTDEAFNNFDGLCYACSPRVDLYFTLEGDQFKDVTPEFITEVNLDAMRKRLNTVPVDRFRQLSSTQDLAPDLGEAKAAVLNLVLAYLYSGHEQDAWKALEENWPKSDAERIKQQILAARGKGTLKFVQAWNRDHLAE